MHTLWFWRSWHKPYQYFFWVLSLLLVLAIGFFWYSHLLSPAPVITWQHYQELQQEEIPVRFIQVGLHSLPIHADNFMIYEAQLGSGLQPNLPASYIFLTFILIFSLVSLTLITTLNRFWFLIGVGTFSLFIISLQLETLEVFGLTNKLPAAAILIFVLALAYYFQAFRNQTSFLIRLLSFTFLFLILGAGVIGFSQVQNPLLHISANGYTAGFILSLVFILMIGPEIPAAFISILTQSTRQTKSLQHFLVFTGFYLLNLLLAYGINIGYLDIDIWIIDFFFLFTISSMLGIWGFRQREAQYESILPADPFGIFLFLSLAFLSFSTVGYLVATANDVVIGLFKDIIMYSHLGYGIIFLLYILSNFGSMLSKNLQVHKVLYKPTTMPYFTFRMMGLITCFAFLVFDTSWKTALNQIYAGNYNGHGDVYYAQNEADLAEGFYNKSIFYRNQNHHAHYALASIQSAKLQLQKERLELAEASNGNPTEFAYLNLSESYLSTGNPLQALMILKQAKEQFPTSGIIHNGLGLVFSKLKMPDSALLSFQEARKSRVTKEIAETNLLATSAKFKLTYPADSLLQLIGSQKQGPKANTLALANLQNLPIDIDFIYPKDTVITVTQATFICNYFINQLQDVDTIHLARAVDLARKPSNDYFKESILVAASQAYYAQGMVRRAFDLTREVAYNTGRGKYFALLGMWSLEQNNPQIAANYFEIAKDKRHPKALLYEAIAQTESDSLLLALPLWDSLARTTDEADAEIANHMRRILTTAPSQAKSITDEDKYWYAHYKINWLDTLSFWEVAHSIQQEELKARAILDFSKKWHAQDNPATAIKILEHAKGLTLTDKRLYDQILILNLMLLAESNTELFLQQDLEKIQSLKHSFPNELIYLNTLQDEYTGRANAQSGFDYLSTANIHFTEGLISSAHYFSSDTTDRIKSYSIIVSGLLARPNSIKLLKAYIKEAALIGFDDEANESLDKLRTLLPARYFNQYIKENPDFFDIEG